MPEDRRSMGEDEEKANRTSNGSREHNSVNSSTRLPNSTSSRSSHYSNSSSKRSNPYSAPAFHSARNRSRSPYRAERKRSRSPYRAERKRSRSPYRAERKKSRSPYRASKDKQQNDTQGVGRKEQRKSGHVEEHAFGEPPAKRLRSRSRSPYRKKPVGEQIESRSAKDKHSERPSTTADQSADNVATNAEHASNDTEALEPSSKLTDAELIEQRRRKREAIRAKHKTQPLLVKALDHVSIDAKAPESPVESASAPSPPSSLNSPRTPALDQSPASPAASSPASFTVDNVDDLVHASNADNADDGPSAADYDPTMDMQEDRRDLQTKPADTNGEGQKEINGDADMFADEDDMFATPSNQPVKPLATTQAKTLDRSLQDNWDYPDGHYRIIIGELLDGKYAVQQQIGKGTFATVVRAKDNDGRQVAVKIACNNDTMYKAGTKEMSFLKELNESDPEDKRHIIRLLGNFDHKGHMCLVFENLHADLRETLKKYGRNVGLNLTALRAFAQQMFQALHHLQRKEILHADLKPDNILVNEKLNSLKICDIGTATKIQDAEVTPYLVSRFYRAPEVMLGMPLDYGIDMWSIGCTLFELYTGRILFAGIDNNQMLKAIQECRGKIPNRMLKKSTLFDSHFDQFGNFISVERDKITGQTAMRQPNLTKIGPGKDLKSKIMTSTKDVNPSNAKEIQAFADLLDKCLQLDPQRRISPVDGMKHHFITRMIPGEKTAKKVVPAMAPSKMR